MTFVVVKAKEENLDVKGDLAGESLPVGGDVKKIVVNGGLVGERLSTAIGVR